MKEMAEGKTPFASKAMNERRKTAAFVLALIGLMTGVLGLGYIISHQAAPPGSQVLRNWETSPNMSQVDVLSTLGLIVAGAIVLGFAGVVIYLFPYSDPRSEQEEDRQSGPRPLASGLPRR